MLVALGCASSAVEHGNPSAPVDPGKLPQTSALPSDRTPSFGVRIAALWRGIVTDSVAAAMPAFFPRAAYLQVKQISNPSADYQQRLLGAYRLETGFDSLQAFLVQETHDVPVRHRRMLRPKPSLLGRRLDDEQPSRA